MSATRVLRIITRLNIGGPSIQAITLSKGLTPRGFETCLLHGQLGPGEGDMQHLLSGDVDARMLPALRRPVAPMSDAIAFVQIYRKMCAFRPALVHTHMAKAGTIGRLAAALYNRTVGASAPARVVHTYHGHVLDGYFKPRTARLIVSIERRLARASDAIIAVSPRIRDELLSQFGIGRPDQYRVIPLGFDLKPFAAIDSEQRRKARDTLAVTPDAHVVSTVGRLVPIKHHQLFLDVAALVAEQDPRAVFLIAGDGECRQDLETHSRALGLHDRVRFLGWRRDLATIYGASDVFLLTSRNEGTPVALIESLAAAVPGVSTDVGGVRDVIESDEIGLVAPFGDARALAGHVRALLDNPERRCAMGECGRQSVLARYDLDRLVDDIERLYRELL